MWKKIKWFLILTLVLGLVVTVYLGGALSKRAALSVDSDPQGQAVYLDDEEVGQTPYFSDQLDAGDRVVRFGDFNQKIQLTSGALTVVDWVLAPSEVFSLGHVVWFSPSSTGSELLVITKPAAEIFLEGESLGEAPLSKPVEPGEYELEVKKEGYIPGKIKVSVRDGFRLNVSLELALNPFPFDPGEGSSGELSSHKNLTMVDLTSSHPLLLADFPSWVKGAAFWDSRFGEDSDSGEYDFFLTGEGKLYDSQGSEVSLESLTETQQQYRVGYLGSGGGISSSASNTLSKATGRLYPTPPKVRVLETGLGFLRVRSGPGTTYDRLGQAQPGDEYTYLGERDGWFKIDFKGQEGWVSGEFARKL